MEVRCGVVRPQESAGRMPKAVGKIGERYETERRGDLSSATVGAKNKLDTSWRGDLLFEASANGLKDDLPGPPRHPTTLHVGHQRSDTIQGIKDPFQLLNLGAQLSRSLTISPET